MGQLQYAIADAFMDMPALLPGQKEENSSSKSIGRGPRQSFKNWMFPEKCPTFYDDAALKAFRKLGYSYGDVNKLNLLYSKFMQPDHHFTHASFCAHYGVSGGLIKTILHLLEKHADCPLNFDNFGMTIWNLCAHLDRWDLTAVAFAIYDTHGGGWILADKRKGLVDLIWDEQPMTKEENAAIEIILPPKKTTILDIQRPEDKITSQLFLKFVKEHPLLIRPLVDLQFKLRKQTLGLKRWKKLAYMSKQERTASESTFKIAMEEAKYNVFGFALQDLGEANFMAKISQHKKIELEGSSELIFMKMEKHHVVVISPGPSGLGEIRRASQLAGIKGLQAWQIQSPLPAPGQSVYDMTTPGIQAKDLPAFQEPVIPPRIVPDKTPKTPLTEEELAELEEEARAKIEQAKKDKAERNRQQRNSFLSHEMNRAGFKTPRPDSAVPAALVDVDGDVVSSGKLVLPPLDTARSSDNGKKLLASSVTRKPRRKPSISAPSSPRGRPRATGMDLIASSSGGIGHKHHTVVVEGAMEEEASRRSGNNNTKSRSVAPAGSRPVSVAGSRAGSVANTPRSQTGPSVVGVGVGVVGAKVNEEAIQATLNDSQKSTDTHTLKTMSKSQKTRTINNRRSFA